MSKISGKLRHDIIASAFEESDYAINITDLDGNLIKVNKAYLKLYKFVSESEVVGRTQRIIRSPKTPMVVHKDMWTTIKADRTWRGEITNQATDGSDVFVYLTITPVFRRGKKAGYMGFSLDRSQQVLLERQLLHANKLVVLGTLGAGLAHELNNPLTSVSLEAEFLCEALSGEPGSPDTGQLLEAANAISRGADRMKTVIEHLMTYSRQPEGGNLKELYVEEWIHESFIFLDKQLKNRGIKIELDLQPGLWILGSKSDLQSVLHNLLTNSRDAFEASSTMEKRIRIRTQLVEPEWLLVDYLDNATGIPEDVRERIFDPFFTTKKEGRGTGLGMSISKRILNAHGGRIECVPDSRGARFLIHLPLERSTPLS